MKYWVNPPHGDQYGFPKVWDKGQQPDWEKWIVSQGYPSCLLNKITSVQMWPAKDRT